MEDTQFTTRRKKKINLFIYLTAISVNCLSFSTGATFPWTSPVIPKLKGTDENPLPQPISLSEESWIASLLSLGATFGPLITGISADKIGRKKTLMLFAIPMIIAHLMFAFGNHVNYFLVGRFILGVGASCAFSIVPMYIGEVAEPENRGLIGCIMGIMINLATLYIYVLGPFVSIRVFSFCNLIPLIIFIVTFGLFIPESPYYLLAINKTDEAKNALIKLRTKSDNAIEKELMEITSNVEESKSNKASIKDLFKTRGMRRGLLVSCGLMLFQQCSGISAVLGYMESIFNATGSSIPPHISVIIIGAVQFFTSLLTSQLVDRLGRRILLLVSASGECLSLVLLGFYFYLQNKDYDMSSLSWLPILSLILYIIFYNIGFGPLPWPIMGELFPSNMKSLGSTITSCVCLSIAFLVAMFFPYLSEMLGMALSFWMFAIFCGAAVIFVATVVPETKGKSLLEIQMLLKQEKVKMIDE